MGETNWIRRFDLSGAHGITWPFMVNQVFFSVGFADKGAHPSNPVEVRTYEIPAGAPLLYANLHHLATTNVNVGDGTNYGTSVFIGGTVSNPVTMDLVVEIRSYDHFAAGTGGSFMPGFNDAGETAGSFMSASDCGLSEPVPLADTVPTAGHLLMTVCGSGPPVSTEQSTWGRIKAGYR